jgi:hypothetical protein
MSQERVPVNIMKGRRQAKRERVHSCTLKSVYTSAHAIVLRLYYPLHSQKHARTRVSTQLA